jgi:hypothetical protein
MGKTVSKSAKQSVNAMKGRKSPNVRKELKKTRGRPPSMSPEMIEKALELIEQGKVNLEVSQALGISHETFYATLARDRDFSERYAVVKRQSTEVLVDQARQVNRDALTAENGHQVAAHKHLADALRWEAARRAPTKWGEKAVVEITGQIDLTDRDELAKRLAFLEAMLNPSQLQHGQVIDITPLSGPDTGTNDEDTDPT